MKKIYAMMVAALFATAAFAQNINQPEMREGAPVKIAPQSKKAALGTKVMEADKALLLQNKIENGAVSGMKKVAAASEVISDTPDGTLYDLYYSSYSYYLYYYYYVYLMALDGTAAQLVEGTDGNVYIKNIIGNYPTGTWIKGSYDSEGNIEVTFPQLVYSYDYYGTTYDYYVYKMTYDSSESTYVVYDGDQTMTFSWDGTTLAQLDNDYLIGLTDEDGTWQYYGDYNIVATLQTDEAVTLPESGTTEDYVLTYKDSYIEDASYVTSVTIDGSDIYVQLKNTSYGIDGYVKGTISGDKATFPTAQLLGVEDSYNGYVYLLNVDASEEYFDYVEYYGEEYADYAIYNYYYYSVNELLDADIEFDYDADAKTLKSDDVVLLNQGKNNVYYYAIYGEPELSYFEEKAGTPQTPDITYFYDWTDSYGYGAIIFEYSYYDTDGNYMNPDKLYYSVYIDDDVLVLYLDEYYYIDEDGMEEIPINYTDSYSWDIIAYSGYNYFYYYAVGFDKIGVQLIYYGGDEVNKSEIAYYYVNGDTGIDSTVSDAAVKSITFTDIAGRAVSQPTKGLYIATETLSDGTVRSYKTIVK